MGRRLAIAAGSTVQRRALGRLLWQLREKSGLSVPEAARLSDMSIASVYRYEAGVTGLKLRDAKDLCKLYNANAKMTAIVVGLVTASERNAGWWVNHETIGKGSGQFELRRELRDMAGRVRCYAASVVPMLAQTPEYSKALSSKAAHAAMAHWLDRPMNRLEMVLSESVLRCEVGGTDIMATQRERLRELANHSNVLLRIVPFSAGAHVGLNTESFEILDYYAGRGARPPEPTTVHVDGYLGSVYYDNASHQHEVSKFESAFATLLAASMSATKSRALLDEFIEDGR